MLAFMLQVGLQLLLTLLDPLPWIGASDRHDRKTRDRRIWQATEL